MEIFEKNVILEKKQNFLVSELSSRYGLGKSSVYGKMKVLEIKPFREGKKAYISPEDLQLLDDLNTYLKENKDNETKEFVQMCIESGRIVQKPIKSKPEPKLEQPEESKSEAIVLHEQLPSTVVESKETEYLAVNQTDSEISSLSNECVTIAELREQKQQNIDTQDLLEVNLQSQERAFKKAIAFESMTLIYESTENFTIPGLKEQLAEHRQACDRARIGKGSGERINDFLSQARAVANGSTKSPNSNNSTSATLNTATTNR